MSFSCKCRQIEKTSTLSKYARNSREGKMHGDRDIQISINGLAVFRIPPETYRSAKCGGDPTTAFLLAVYDIIPLQSLPK